MILYRIAKRAKDHAVLGELFLHRGADRYAVEDRVDRDAREEFLLRQRDTELLVGPKQLGVYLVEALERLHALRSRVVDERVVVDWRILNVPPMRLFHRQPAAVGFEPPLQHER